MRLITKLRVVPSVVPVHWIQKRVQYGCKMSKQYFHLAKTKINNKAPSALCACAKTTKQHKKAAAWGTICNETFIN